MSSERLTTWLGWTWQSWRVALEWASDTSTKPTLDEIQRAAWDSLHALDKPTKRNEYVLEYAIELKSAYVQEHSRRDRTV